MLIYLTQQTSRFFTAHSTPEIDIAVLPLSGDYIVNNKLEFPAFDIDKNALTSVQLRDNGIGATF